MTAFATPENVAALDRAVELISDPARWAVRNFALTAENAPCSMRASDASRWCAAGALYKFGVGHLLWTPADRVAESFYRKTLSEVNDDLGRIPAKHCIEALAAQLRSELP